MTINIRGSNTGESVAQATKQTGETADRWSWVEPSVWTPRMLSALEQGVKGGKWFSLIDKVYATANLAQAYTRVAANGGAAGTHDLDLRLASRLTVADQPQATGDV